MYTPFHFSQTLLSALQFLLRITTANFVILVTIYNCLNNNFREELQRQSNFGHELQHFRKEFRFSDNQKTKKEDIIIVITVVTVLDVSHEEN